MTQSNESQGETVRGRRSEQAKGMIVLTPEEVALQAHLATTFNDLKKSLAVLRRCIATGDARRAAVTFATGLEKDATQLAIFQDGQARERAGRAVEQIHLEKTDDRTKKAIIALREPGILAAGPETLAAAAKANAAKAAFKKAVLDLPEARRKYILHKVTGASIHLKQAYRAIQVLEHKPVRVSFLWALGITEIIRMTKIEVLEFLSQKEAEGEGVIPERSLNRISNDREQIGKHPDGTTFVRVRPIPAHPRANVLWPDKPRSMLHASLPFLYLDDGRGLPEYIPLQPQRTSVRAKRIDRKARTPILPFWGIYAAS